MKYEHYVVHIYYYMKEYKSCFIKEILMDFHLRYITDTLIRNLVEFHLTHGLFVGDHGEINYLKLLKESKDQTGYFIEQ